MKTQNEPRITKRIQLRIPEDLHRRLRVEAAKRRTTLQDLLVRWTAEKQAEAERPADPARPLRILGPPRGEAVAIRQRLVGSLR